MRDLPNSTRLKEYFARATADSRIGGADVLRQLSNYASACVDDTYPARDAVAFALAVIFSLHADDKDERVVTSDDSYALMASGEEHLSSAVEFLQNGSNFEEAIQIIAALARLTPDRLCGR
jgi:hypothetical protein